MSAPASHSLTPPARALLLACAGGASAALAIAGVPGPIAGGLAVGWAGLAVAFLLRVPPPLPIDPAALERDRLRLLDARYPLLMEACLDLSAAREPDDLAARLLSHACTLVPRAATVRVFLSTSHASVEASALVCRASGDAAGRPCPAEPGADEYYVAQEARPLIRRAAGMVRLLVPLRADRRGQGHARGHDQGPLRGVLDVLAPATAHGAEEELLTALGRLGGLGLAAVDLVEQARSLALTDELTGLFGAAEFSRRLEEQIATARRQQRPLGVIQCDLDHLKIYNDTHGHLAGDEALRAVGAVLTRELPTGCLASRRGGEEFAVCALGLDGERLRQLAEWLRAALSATVPEPAHPERRITASFGVATLRDDDAAATLLARADAGCYRAKGKGRNRVETI